MTGAGIDIALVGAGCVLPDAFDVDTFWRNTLAGHAAIRPLADSARCAWSRYVDEAGLDPDKSRSRMAAVVEGWSFDWRTFRMPPADVEAINPLQLMTLTAGVEALSAVRELPRDRTGIFIGSTGLGWQRDSGLRIRLEEVLEAVEASPRFAALDPAARRRVLARVRAELDARLRPVSEDNVVNAAASVAAGRIAMHFDLTGLHYAVDAGFASSLAALEVGVRALRDGTLDVALVGGVSELLTPLELVAFSRVGGLASSGLRPFDRDAEGTLLGEGVAMLALTRLDDAVARGDDVIAVIRGVGGATDPPVRSLLAPDPQGQATAMRRAYEDAGVDPATLAFCECHATGTPVGDASELEALRSVVGAKPLLVGSVKGAVGHLRSGAGAVGLLRAALALRHGVVPRQVGYARPSEALLESGFVVPTENAPLTERGAPLRAGVSSFGFGGIGYHAVLEAFDPVRARRARPRRPRPAPEPIAVVGMGGVFPGADSVDALWERLLEGFDATREVPEDRWDLDRYYAAERGPLDKTYTRLGCFLDRLPTLGPALGIPPSAAETIDPSHLLCLEVADRALQDAGLGDDWADRDRAAVCLAFLPYQGKKFLADIRVNAQEIWFELERALRDEGLDAHAIRGEAQAELGRRLPSVTEDSITGWLGSLNAGRVARRHRLGGPHFVVDAACASTHAAVHAAVQALRHRAADTVLTGGVWADMQPEFFVAACRFDALSATGSTPFDADADGFIPGEGAGVFVLRRLSDALRDGQRVHAVIRGVAGSSDGKGASVLAPTLEGEASAMRRALDEAQLEGADIDYVECHGTGTALGDVIEANACGLAFGDGRATPLRIGSVKSNIGHLNAAAGVPGLVKAVLAVREGRIPASLKVRRPNPKIDYDRGRLEVVRETAPWPRRGDAPRRAGVSSFGVGGANMHVIVEEHRAASPLTIPRPRTSVPAAALPAIARVAAASPAACVAALEALAERAAREGLDGLAPTGHGPWRAAVVAPSPDALGERVAMLARGVERGHPLDVLRQRGVYVAQPGAPVISMFPGQGPQYANMARALAGAAPAVAAALEEADEGYRALTGRSLTSAFWTDDPDRWVQSDEDIHTAVFAVNVALYRWLASRGLRPRALLGQSAGELAAFVAAGSLTLAEGLRASLERTRAVLDLEVDDPGRMLAIQADAARIEPMLGQVRGYLAVAADNGPAACIVSGDRPAVAALAQRLGALGLQARELAVSHGYHSQKIEAARPRYRRVLEQLRFRAPTVPIVSTITGGPLRLAPQDAPAHLTSQLVEPVRLREAVHAAWEGGGRLFVEHGPKWSLATFAASILEGREHWTQPIVHPKVGELELAARAVACLGVHGHDDAWPTETAFARRALAGVGSLARHAADADPGALADALRRIGEIVEEVLGPPDASGAWAPTPAPSAQDDAPRRDPDADERGAPQRSAPAEEAARAREAPEPSRRAAAPEAREAAPPAAATTSREGGDAPVLERLVEGFAARTGYPEEMLEPDLDLEADLGIDTVKQVAVLTALREGLGLPPDPDFVLRDHRTLRAQAEYFASRLGPATRAESPPPVTEEPPPPPALDASGADVEVGRRLIEAFAARTGYPEEMLEPDLDLEADLGIDTVKQVAVLTALREGLGLPPDPDFVLRDHRTLRQLTAYFGSRVGRPERARTGRSSVAPRRSSRPSARPSVPPGPGPSTTLRAQLVSAFAAKTGYPEEMLEPDLDLEADLGIDTVKQVAVLTTLREGLGLPPDPDFVLRDHRTLRQLAEYFVGRIGGARPPARSRPPGRRASHAPPSTDVERLLRARLAQRTGYPEEMLEAELDLEADLGIDTVKQVAVLTGVREALDLEPDPEFVLRDHRTIAAITSYFEGRLGERPPPAGSIPPPPPVPDPETRAGVGAPAVFTERSTGTVRSVHDSRARVVQDVRLLRVALAGVALPEGRALRLSDLRFESAPLVPEGQQLTLEAYHRREAAGELGVEVHSRTHGCHLSLTVGSEAAPPEASLEPTVHEELRRGGPPGEALQRLVGRRLDRAEGSWARSLGFDTVIGGARVVVADPATAAAALTDLALFFSGTLWMAALGTPHLVRSIEAIRVRPLGDARSQPVWVTARLGPRVGGRASADVTVHAEDGTTLAVIETACGASVGATADVHRAGDELLRWRNLVRRLGGDVLPGEDGAW